MDEFAQLALWYCHQAVDPLIAGVGHDETNQNMRLELSITAVTTEYSSIALAKKMLILGFNFVHEVEIDVPYNNSDPYCGIEPLVIMTAIANYHGWYELVEYTDPIWAQCIDVFSPERVVAQYKEYLEEEDRDMLDAMSVRYFSEKTHALLA